jgi:hypothetical protein
MFSKYEYHIDSIDEKPNEETVNNSLDEEKDIKLDQTDEEIEAESLNKDPTPDQEGEEHPKARFVFPIPRKIYYYFHLDHVVYRN